MGYKNRKFIRVCEGKSQFFSTCFGGGTYSYDTFHYGNTAGYLGTSIFGPSTAAFTSASGPTSLDATGAADCCVTIQNNVIHDVGLEALFVSCLSSTGGQNFVTTRNTLRNCPGMGYISSTMGAVVTSQSSTNFAPSYGGINQGILIAAAQRAPWYGNSFTYNDVSGVGAETVSAYGTAYAPGTVIAGSAQNSDFGAIYLGGPHDGDGTAAREEIAYNKIHDISGAKWPLVTATGLTNGAPRNYSSSVLLYCDFESGCNGLNMHHNVFHNPATNAFGFTNSLGALVTFGGGARSTFSNNIWAAVLNPGAVYTDWLPIADHPSFENFKITSTAYLGNWAINQTFTTCTVTACYTLNGYNIYKATANGTTAASGPGPTGTAGPYSDNTMTWTYVATMPGAQQWRVETGNIFAWSSSGKTTSCGSSCYINDPANIKAPLLVASNNNLYSMAGNYLTYWGQYTTFPTWKATTVANSTTGETGSLYGSSAGADSPGIVPNFVNLATGDLRFNGSQVGPGTATACSGVGPNGVAPGVSPACGLGFVPWDYNDVGAR